MSLDHVEDLTGADPETTCWYLMAAHKGQCVPVAHTGPLFTYQAGGHAMPGDVAARARYTVLPAATTSRSDRAITRIWDRLRSAIGLRP